MSVGVCPGVTGGVGVGVGVGVGAQEWMRLDQRQSSAGPGRAAGRWRGLRSRDMCSAGLADVERLGEEDGDLRKAKAGK